jgi:hypothetical protein
MSITSAPPVIDRQAKAAVRSTLSASAVIVRADRALWDGDTHWLISALGVASLPTWVTWVKLARTRGLLPRPSDGRVPGDWLDDALPLVNLLAARLPPAGPIAGWLERRDAAG